MAYYQDAPKKKTRINYAEKGSWDEEGSHYSDRKPGDRRKNSGRTAPANRDSYGDRRSENRGSGADRGSNGRKGYGEGRSPSSNRTTGSRSSGRKSSYGESRGSEEWRSYGENREPSRRSGAPSRDFGSRGNDRNAPRREGRGFEERGGDRFGPGRPAPERKGYQDFEYRRPAEAFHAEPEEPQEDHILCGRNPIREALRSGREIEKILVQKGELSGSAKEIVSEAREKKIMVQEADKRRMDEIAPHHQGLIAFASAYEYAEIEEMLAEAERRGEDPFLILLDGVTDPHNLGAVIRTAECAGAHGVIIPIHRSVGLTPAAVKASAGAIEHMKVARVVNLNRTIEDLKRIGIWTYAVTMDGRDFEKVDFHGGTALIIGAEGEGISRLTAEKCDMKVSLPLKGEMDSLNASVAAGVMMYRVLSCRRKG